ncbi:MAG: cation diffusion facilitator family transporter [Acidimicrobiales bacterium]
MSGAHGHGFGAASAGSRHKRSLQVAFSLTLAYMVAEVGGGLATGSLALLSDAAHMGTDVLGLGMALAAVHLASRPSSSQRTWGTYRLEVLAALANGLLLFGVAGYVLFEAWRRFADPQEVAGLPLMVIAAVGLAVNVVSFRLLRAGSDESLNVKGAYLEVVSDMLGSVGVIVAGAVVATTGWAYADPIIGAGIGLFIVPRTWRLCAQAVRIIMEIAPPDLDVDEVREALAALPGVAEVHDLHVWTLTSGIEAASCHVVIAEDSDPHEVLDAVSGLLRERFGVGHSTIQCEAAAHADDDSAPCEGCPGGLRVRAGRHATSGDRSTQGQR